MPNPDPLKPLADLVKAKHVIAFVGAGLSVAAGAPAWKQLVGQLVAAAEGLNLPGSRRKLAVCREQPAERELQEHVSSMLSEQIDSLLDQLMDEDTRVLLINSTYAWTRWYAPRHATRLVRLRAKARRVQAGRQTCENLERWVGRRQPLLPA
jgi:hypothetical protein